jgi:acetylornithine/N-succinyldiaminopimelate aminotransferase
MSIMDLTSGGRTSYVLGAENPALLAARTLGNGDCRSRLKAALERTTTLSVLSFHASSAEAKLRALDIARAATGRSALVACRGGAVAPGTRLISHGDGLQMEKSLGQDQPAAFMTEVVQVQGGVRVPPPDYFDRVRAACDKTGSLLLIDETAVGLGRTGTFFAIEKEKVAPDLVAVGLSFLPGVEGSAVLGRPDLATVAGALPEVDGMSNEAAAVALRALELIHDDGLVTNARKLGKALQKAVIGLVEKQRRWAMDTRGRGLARGLTLWDDPKIAVAACLARGVTIAALGETSLLFAPPLNATAADLAETIGLVDAALAEA